MRVLTGVDWILIAILATAFAAFSLGYLRGMCRGRQIGEKEGIIKLREKSFYLGKCSLCSKLQEEPIDLQKLREKRESR